jgi:hypothetical protein
MKMTELQFAGMTISLSTLGQVDLSDNDPEMLQNLAFLLEEASKNVARAIQALSKATDAQQQAQAARYEREHGEPPF